MRYIFVLVLSLASGGGVYLLTLRTGEQEQLAGLGFAPESPAGRRSHEDPPPPVQETDPEAMGGVGYPTRDEPGYTYLRIATSGPSWQERVQGFVGLIVLVTVSAATLAFAVYQLGHLINHTIEHFLK